ncbi:hypothetical protein [Desulfurobacterium indicum]|uniref:Uncharacterized protein n=1 Tax=Desulfurobacterium indicum TaxID=1914305 RepID=A0A1R1MK66_9BACT|nr:hypothetical protein [Desulfurobacterium indicum]OMH40201.1 hypothetical protein BLW93_06530 [Desulfurobacterium indicum]
MIKENKRYDLGLMVTSILTFIGAAALMFSTRYLPVKVPPQTEKKIEYLQKTAANPELIGCYKKQLEFQRKEEKKDEAYASLVQAFCLLFMLNGAVQLYLLFNSRFKKR